MNYELDVYLDALKDFPSQDTKLFTEKGLAFCQKTDIFKATLWFSYKEDPANWHVLSAEQVNEIIAKNKSKEKVSSLEEYAVVNLVEIEERVVFENVVGQDSLTRFDQPKRSKNSRNRNRNKKRKGNSAGNTNQRQSQNSKKGNSQNNKGRNNKNAKPSNRRPKNA